MPDSGRLPPETRVVEMVNQRGGPPQGLDVWGPMGRWIFLNHPRGSWQYDVVCALIILLLFLLPGV